MSFKFHLYEPFISQVFNGLKVYEGRLPLPSVMALRPGTIVPVYSILDNGEPPLFHVVIESLHHYASFRNAINHLGVEPVLPGMTDDEAVKCYNDYIPESIQAIDGIVMIRISRVRINFSV